MKFKRTIPNYLSIFRIFAGPAIMVLFLYGEHSMAFELTWIALYVCACFTDWLDGWIAKKDPSQASDFGKLIDPIADKVFVISIIILIYLLDIALMWELILMGVIIVREVSVTFIRKPFVGKTNILSVSQIGRWKAGTQMVAFGVILDRSGIIHVHFDRLFPYTSFNNLGSTLLICATGLTALSGLLYMKEWLTQTKQQQIT